MVPLRFGPFWIIFARSKTVAPTRELEQFRSMQESIKDCRCTRDIPDQFTPALGSYWAQFDQTTRGWSAPVDDPRMWFPCLNAAALQIPLYFFANSVVYCGDSNRSAVF
jgi:hypothetical protein